MAFYKAAERAAAVSAPAPDIAAEAAAVEQALQPLANGLGSRYNLNYVSDYDAWLSADPGLVQCAKALPSLYFCNTLAGTPRSPWTAASWAGAPSVRCCASP